MISNSILYARMLLRAAEITQRDELRENLIDEALGVISGNSFTASTVEMAKNTILEMLVTGKKAVKDVDDALIQAGISRATVQRAKLQMNKEHLIKEWSEGVGTNHVWYMDMVKDEDAQEEVQHE